MKQTEQNANGGVITLRNVAAGAKLMEHLITRAHNLPGMAVMFGDSGLGKTCAAAYLASKFKAAYVECRSFFTKKSLLITLCRELGIRQPGRTIFDMVGQVGEELSISRRPLILDEMDHIVDRNLVELVRDIYEVSYAPILMIGEEMFPAKLKRWERFHNRVLDWVRAEPCDTADAQKLARLYSQDVEIAPDLLAKIMDVSRGVARRICVNVELVRHEAKSIGKNKADLNFWGTRVLYSGEAPPRRAS